MKHKSACNTHYTKLTLLLQFYFLLLFCFGMTAVRAQNIYPSSGNVGIGTTAPPWKLSIMSDGGNGILLGSPSPNPEHNFLIMNNISGGWNPITQVGDNLILFQGSAPDAVNTPGLVLAPWSNNPGGIRITPTGNVAIGTVNPGSYKLAVEGTIGARKVVVTLTNPFPDYVFKKEYNLTPLKNLEKYIKNQNHLPEVPSADSVQRNGLDLGSNQAILLKKIEELTLYVIELNKKNEMLEGKFQKLSKQIRKKG